MQEPHLKHLDEFKKVLNGYHVSERAKKALDGLRLVLLAGPSSVGRNTIIRRLMDTGRYYFIVSDTTRPPQVRDGQLEKNGVQYFFRTEEEVLQDLKSGEFLEAEILHGQQVSGISIRELEKAKNSKKIAVSDVDIGGVSNILSVKPDAIAIMLLPPSIEEWQARLRARGAMSEHELNRRQHTATKVFKAGLENDYFKFLVAEDVERSMSIIGEIAAGRPNPHQERGRQLLKGLLDELSIVMH